MGFTDINVNRTLRVFVFEDGSSRVAPQSWGARMTETWQARFVSWLTEQGASARSIPDFLGGYCAFLNNSGFAIRRCNLATLTVHPQMVAIRHVWTDTALPITAVNPAVVISRRQYHLGEAMIDEVVFNAMNETNPQYLASPFCQIESCGELYEPIHPPGEPQPFPVFDDLARQGCTGYFGLYLRSFEGIRQQIGLATSLPGGFASSQCDDLRWSLRLFTLHLNTLLEFDIKNTLARAYIGVDPGERVCAGMVKLGQVVSLDAAIWFSDLRGFTEISEGMSSQQLVESLNAYFEAVVTPLYGHGGEVLKYIGDAILAVFPADRHGSPTSACGAALAARIDADAALASLNLRRGERAEPRLTHGIALHYGQAQYGNIGSPERLDFTLIGREVNIASRIESLTKSVGEPVLLSEAFVATSGVAARPVGSFAAKGIAQPLALFAPAKGA